MVNLGLMHLGSLGMSAGLQICHMGPSTSGILLLGCVSFQPGTKEANRAEEKNTLCVCNLLHDFVRATCTDLAEGKPTETPAAPSRSHTYRVFLSWLLPLL